MLEQLPRGNETILVTDDQDAVWDYLIEALQNLGYSVLLAENGEDAVEIYRNNQNEIDLVMLDMIMPKMNGTDAFYELKKINPNVKVLLSSGFVSADSIKGLLKEGAVGFLPKPHRLNELAQEIRRILDESKSM